MPDTQILTGPAAAAAGTGLAERRPIPDHLRPRLAEVVDLFESACTGDRMAVARLQQEALTRGDFSYLLGTAIDRSLMAAYMQAPSVWEQFCSRTTVADFKAKKWDDLLGGQALLTAVPELAEYKQGSVSDAEYSLTVAKYGRKIGLSWETIINDDLNALKDLPNRLAQAARNTENQLATSLLVTATGPDSTFFSVGHANLLSGNPALGVTGLQAAFTHLASKTDWDGNPIVLDGAVLMVPPALYVTAHNLVNAVQVQAATGGGDGTGNNQLVVSGNGLPGNLTVVLNPWIPTIDVSANKATTWYLLPAPAASRPAVTLGFLRGHETPDLRVKADGGQSVGGGAVNALDGSFDTDDIQWRVRHVLGGTTLDYKTAVVSTGAGS